MFLPFATFIIASCIVFFVVHVPRSRLTTIQTLMQCHLLMGLATSGAFSFFPQSALGYVHYTLCYSITVGSNIPAPNDADSFSIYRYMLYSAKKVELPPCSANYCDFLQTPGTSALLDHDDTVQWRNMEPFNFILIKNWMLQSSNASSYSWNPRFKSRLRDPLFWLRYFRLMSFLWKNLEEAYEITLLSVRLCVPCNNFFCVWIRCHGNLFTEPLPSNGSFFSLQYSGF
jgi:hypothetical protein